MSDFDWIGELEDLSPAMLTVMAQALPQDNNGELKWPIFFPRVDVNSVHLRDMFELDERFVADRREWNANGRLIPILTPPMKEMRIVPIEAYSKIDELEMQTLAEGTFGNAAIIEEQIGVRIPKRSDKLAQADLRRLEVDAFQSWALGTVTQRNPQDASKTFTVSFGFPAARYQTAGVAWNAVANAYDEFIAWLEDGISAVGSVAGAITRQNIIKEILDDAPDLTGGVKMSFANLTDRISQDIGAPFQFFAMENELDVFTDGGTAVTRTKVWPAEQLALVPSGLSVGRTAFAPVRRAMQLSTQVPEASIDIRGVTIFHESQNAGKTLELQAQVNAMAIPNEEKMWVIDVGF